MNYLLVGASSAIASSCCNILQGNGHQVTGISRNGSPSEYDAYYQVASYATEDLPAVDHAIDGLVYFPGTVNLKPFHRLTRQDFLNDLEVNFLGAVSVLQQYLPQLKKSGASSVVLISSVAAERGLTMHSSISSAKAALEGLTKALSAEFAPAIRVNCIAPSLVNTPLTEKFVNTPEKMEAMMKRNPMQKVGTPDDIAAMISFLLSPAAGWITGQVIAVDGGMNNISR